MIRGFSHSLIAACPTPGQYACCKTAQERFPIQQLDLSDRTLVSHDDNNLRDRNFPPPWDPGLDTRRGPSMTLTRDRGGAATGGLDALFAPDPLADRTGSQAASRWSMEAAYGFPAFSGRFIGSPHLGPGIATGRQTHPGLGPETGWHRPG
ncbi:MAG: hypothetical protein OXG56_05975 [Gammaproteobacteria bacterium]|nr:hypothetical protein [Gammaproteobacteria bacterium]